MSTTLNERALEPWIGARSNLPWIISVDDHVVEPPTLWTDRLPKKYLDRGPRVVRERAKFGTSGGAWSFERGGADGEWCDWWLYDDLEYPLAMTMAAIGFDTTDVVETITTPITFDTMQPGCWRQKERLADMTSDHLEASMCFPNTMPRFCGQAFHEREDKDLALLCVKAYNDWMIEEWCAGDAAGRLIPLAMVPLWDVELAAAEVRRNAARGCFAVTFSESPYALGLPSVHTGYWDPFFKACEETGTRICMHIGSSSKMPGTSPDAPFEITGAMLYTNVMGSMLDLIFSGTMEKFPELVIVYSEGQVGWMPYVIERIDKGWAKRSTSALPKLPSSYMHHRIYNCIFDDDSGLRNRDVIGIDQICFETDYPHASTMFPNSKRIAEEMAARAGLTDEETWKLVRGNAIRALGLERFGITK